MMRDDLAEVMSNLMLKLSFAGIKLGSILFQAFVFTKLWLWFVIPLGGFPINVFHAVGLLSLIQLTKGTKLEDIERTIEDGTERTFHRYFYSYIWTGLTFLFGYVAQLFM